MKSLTPFLLSISLFSVGLPAASAQNPVASLAVLEPKGFREVAQLRPRSTKEIKSSTWSIGGETLDRDYTDYQSYRHYLGPLGAKRIRLQGGWSKCEKVKAEGRPDQYDFAWLDAVIPDAYSRGVAPWVELSYGNPIYPGGGEPKLGGRIPTSEEALVAWDNWVRAMVNRYKNQVTEWEIWNEPDLNKLNTGEEVAVFYIRTAKLVKSIQPNAKLIALGVAGVPATAFMRPFLDHLKKENALDLVDILTYHGYAPNPDTSYPKIEEMRQLVWSYNPKITFMQGENGAPSTASAVTIGALRQYDWTELSQAKWDLRRMLADHGRGIATNLFTISDIHYAAGDHMTGVNTKGLLKTNPDKTIERPKLAYKAAQHVFSTFDDQLELLDQSKPGVSQATVSAFQYRQRKNGGSLVTLWSAEARPAETYEPKPTDVTLKGKFDQPVFVDLVSGKVYEIPKNQWKKAGDNYTFTAIPVPDYPVLIAEKTVLHLLTPTGQSANPSFKYLGKIAPKNSRDIQASNWSVGAEYMDRDYTVYANWKEYLGKLGVKKARIQSGWAKCEKVKAEGRPGQYDFAWLDEIVNDMVQQGVTPWIDLCYGNPLYSGGGGTTLNAAIPFSGEALAGWKNYVAAVVARYGDKVTEWEIWNEPNYKIAIPDYANFFITTAETVRSVQPKAQIIAFALGSGVDYKFADSVLKIIQERGKLGLVNQISHHRHIPNPDNRDAELELEKVVANYSPTIRIRQGEAGCPSEWNNNFALNHYPWTELTQSKHILRRLLTDLGHDKESCCFTIMDAKTPQEWNHKGLLKANEDQTVAYAKPAYYAFQNLIAVFDNRLERLETYPYSVKKEENSTLSLYAYAEKTNQLQAVTVWIKDNVPSDNNEQTLCDFTFANARFKNPVWVDLIAGTVYEIPKENWSKKENVFRQIPLYDSPILIADKSLITLSVNQ